MSQSTDSQMSDEGAFPLSSRSCTTLFIYSINSSSAAMWCLDTHCSQVNVIKISESQIDTSPPLQGFAAKSRTGWGVSREILHSRVFQAWWSWVFDLPAGSTVFFDSSPDVLVVCTRWRDCPTKFRVSSLLELVAPTKRKFMPFVLR